MLKISHISKTFNPGTVNEKKAITDLSLELKKGDFATIIGSNGAGKSTLFNAICGDFLTDAGSIELDGRDITFMPQHARAKEIGRLYQDPMRGTAPGMTIEENLALAAGKGGWLSRTTRQEKERFREELKKLDIGLEERMSHPVGLLSGGQRQRLTLARALVPQSDILIMDDSASALDYATDARLRKAIQDMKRKPTVFIVSQRTSSIQNADMILVLDDGKIAGQGTHEQLLKSCNIYREIYETQFKKEEA